MRSTAIDRRRALALLGTGLAYGAARPALAERGVVGVYDAAAGFARVGEFPSHGIGPHQIEPMPDGTTLAVANGVAATARSSRRRS